MAQVRIEVDGRTIFDDIITDWHPIPDIPARPGGINIAALNKHPEIRALLDKAMAAALFKATGRHWTPT